MIASLIGALPSRNTLSLWPRPQRRSRRCVMVVATGGGRGRHAGLSQGGRDHGRSAGHLAGAAAARCVITARSQDLERRQLFHRSLFHASVPTVSALWPETLMKPTCGNGAPIFSIGGIPVEALS